MKIAFTGGETGGHFYPIIAIAEAIRDRVREERLVEPQMYFLAPSEFDAQALFENGLVFIRIPAGKVRRYFSLANFLGLFTTFIGFIAALIALYRLYPDVLVSKGGYGSVPALLAARLWRIPVIVHESDARPGRASLLGAKFAKRVAITFEESAKFFPKSAQSKIARTGIPVRKELMRLEPEGARQYLNLESGIPTILILGGSLGAQRINEAVVGGLRELTSFANIIHQTGNANFKEVEGVAKVALQGQPHADRYHPFNYLNAISLKRAAGIADLIISRAGSTAITEIAVWRKPAILIPIPESVSHDQRTNAYAFARTGAAVVIEEANMSPNLIASEAKRISTNPTLAKEMGEKGAKFADLDAAKILAEEILAIGLSHES